ncbi:ATP-NAD kinase family protein [Natrialbaceae archaeon A-CW2]
MEKKTVGLIVNPIAGMGGRVGLKGTDSQEILEQARELGAEPLSPERAFEALEHITHPMAEIDLFTGPDSMGETVARDAGFDPIVVGEVSGEMTTAADTKTVAKKLVETGVEVLLFAGGDGTARDIYDSVGTEVPVIGIPTGVKIYSGAFCATPRAAGELLTRFLNGETDGEALREVMDINEAAYRDNRLSATLHGYLEVPQTQRLIQDPKAGSPANEEAAKRSIATEIIDDMEEDTIYVIGPGTTTAMILEELKVEPTLLGVDAVCNHELIGSDLRETEILGLIGEKPAKVVVGVIGGQGFVFGRGNQQLSWRVLERVGVDNIVIVATQDKLISLNGEPLRVDTGDKKVDKSLAGYTKVVTAVGERMVVPIS